MFKHVNLQFLLVKKKKERHLLFKLLIFIFIFLNKSQFLRLLVYSNFTMFKLSKKKYLNLKYLKNINYE